MINMSKSFPSVQKPAMLLVSVDGELVDMLL